VRIYSRALTDGDIAELCDCPATGVNKAPALSASAIRRTYPNPSGGDTSVDFFVESSGNVELTVYDVAGRLVRTLHTGALARGEHASNWDGRNAAGKRVPSGVYFLRLNTGGVVVSSRLVRIR
jgi:flagellar hook assembly protein FlgD